jgi:hypothetical protein
MRTKVVIIMVAFSLAPVSMTAAEPLVASHVTWKEHFGSSRSDTNTLFSLIAHGYFRAESTNVQNFVDEWLKIHPKAIVISVSTGGPLMTKRPSSRLAYVWVAQGTNTLNVELVRQGCLAPETQLLNPDEKPEVPQNEYDAFVQRITRAGESAKHEKLGIWRNKEQ